MTIRLWRPLRARDAGTPVSSLTSTSPSESLERLLRAWIEESLYDEDVERIALRLDMPDAFDDSSYFYDESLIDADDLYQVIDIILDLQASDSSYFAPKRESLQQFLDDSLSRYTICQDGRGLEIRADAAATAALNDSVGTANARIDSGSAGEHLATAWAKAYAIHPDSVKAYSESIKAVEAAAHAIIEPNNTKATLGTIIGHMRSHSSEFRLMLPAPGIAVENVIGMMVILWTGQTSRHAGQNPTRKETINEARSAVHLAVTLVQWFSSGTICRCPAEPPPSTA